MNELDRLLDLNNIDKNKLLDALYIDIRETILKEICKKMKCDEDFYRKAKQLYFSSNDDDATEKIVMSVCRCKLLDEDISWLTKCVKAFFNKSDFRKPIERDQRIYILFKQNGKCNICGKEITEDTIQIDHIIPWDYVGDELQDNLQGLCADCNSKKSNHVAITVSNLILHAEGAK